tara:strand:- start:38 stop:196 length:159 start_codon:yes stop_codon:yes gene_type:complete
MSYNQSAEANGCSRDELVLPVTHEVSPYDEGRGGLRHPLSQVAEVSYLSRLG